MIDELKNWLISNGFRISNNGLADSMNEEKWYAYRRSVLSARRCECNDDKENIQLVIYPWKFNFDGKISTSVEVEVCGMANSEWWKLRAYGIQIADLPQKLENIERSLVSAWNALADGSTS